MCQLCAGEGLVRVLTRAGFRQAQFVNKTERYCTDIYALAKGDHV